MRQIEKLSREHDRSPSTSMQFFGCIDTGMMLLPLLGTHVATAAVD